MTLMWFRGILWNHMNKTLFVIAGVALLAIPSLHAQGRGRGAGAASRGGTQSIAASRGATYNRSFALNRGSRFGGNRYRGRGRYYYYGGVPYFYPFFDYGFGYPYYGGGFGYGFGYNSFYSDYAGPGPGYYDTPYAGTIVNESAPGNLPPSGTSLQTVIQRQLSKRGYYKGPIDGDFGDSSRTALRHFQKDNRLKDTGRIDEPTLKALGFTDRR